MDKETEDKFKDLDERLKKLEKNSDPKIDLTNSLDNMAIKLRGKIEKIGQQNLIILALYVKSKQSKSNLLDVLIGWGVKKTIHKWFAGGNLNNRLVNTGIVKIDGKNSDDHNLHSLTIAKGIPKANELIKKHELS